MAAAADAASILLSRGLGGWSIGLLKDSAAAVLKSPPAIPSCPDDVEGQKFSVFVIGAQSIDLDSLWLVLDRG